MFTAKSGIYTFKKKKKKKFKLNGTMSGGAAGSKREINKKEAPGEQKRVENCGVNFPARFSSSIRVREKAAHAMDT